MKLTEAEIKELKKYRESHTLNECADKFNICPATV